MKKIKIYGEAAWLVSLLLLSFSVAMTAAADFGLSMIVAPAYILSLRLDALSFGQCEYIMQGALFILMCLALGKIKPIYFMSFFTCLVYGLMLDGWRAIIPIFNPVVTAPGSMDMGLRIVFFVLGLVICAFCIALCFYSYIYPQVYDFFVKAMADRFSIRRDRFKIGFDVSFLILACAMTFIFFARLEGVGVGTVVTTLFNGLLIGFFSRQLEKHCDFVALWPDLEKRFKM